MLALLHEKAYLLLQKGQFQNQANNKDSKLEVHLSTRVSKFYACIQYLSKIVNTPLHATFMLRKFHLVACAFLKLFLLIAWLN